MPLPICRRLLVCLLSAVLVALAGAALAHMAPDVNKNNRYLKITPMADRVRLAYTVYLGEVPGQAARTDMDGNGDGVISDSESEPFGATLGQEVKKGIVVKGDDQNISVEWDQVHVGLGDSATAGGALSVDLIAWLCLDPDRDQHSLSLFDGYVPSLPGEGELRLDLGPGIDVDRAAVGETDELLPKITWEGAESPISENGYHLEYTIDRERAVVPDDQRCKHRQTHPASGRALHVAGGAAGFLLVIVLAWLGGRRYKRKKAAPSGATSS